VQDGVSGILEPAGSVEAMARRAAELLRDPERHGAMAKAAVERARVFDADRIVPMYEQLYQKVLG
jgi:glycosyltransferase involved in cell wall biosynthesis